MHLPSLQRVVDAGDIETVAALAVEIWNDHFPAIIGQEQVDYMLAELQSVPAITRQIRKDGYEYYLVFEEDRKVGYFAIVPHAKSSSLQLSKIYLKRSRRGRGLGRALLEQIEKRCASCGIRKIWLTVNKDNAGSIAFYERMGFDIADATVTDIGHGFIMDDYRMTKRLGCAER